MYVEMNNVEEVAEQVVETPDQNEQADEHAVSDPVAIIKGEALQNLPLDLYIPPDALKVFLDSFQGPLDLLLYLIKRQNLDILDIPVAKITA